jgi:hypothetical protein
MVVLFVNLSFKEGGSVSRFAVGSWRLAVARILSSSFVLEFVCAKRCIGESVSSYSCILNFSRSN